MSRHTTPHHFTNDFRKSRKSRVNRMSSKKNTSLETYYSSSLILRLHEKIQKTHDFILLLITSPTTSEKS